MKLWCHQVWGAVLLLTAVPVLAQSSSDNDKMALVTVRGTLTSEGTECQALRSRDGVLYTLLGDLQGFKPGDRVKVRGARVQMSYCMQGQTLRVESVAGVK